MENDNKTAVINVRVTPGEREAAVAAAEALGMTLSDVVRNYLARVVRRVQKNGQDG